MTNKFMFDTELTVVMGRSRDWDELQFSWIEWRRLTGQKIRDLFEQVVDLSNQAAQLNREYICYSATAVSIHSHHHNNVRSLA
jgi:hypothetical protein